MDNYIVSARKYRPMTFSSVVGQEALTTTLRNTVRTGKLAHAYLFCGPRGVGKTTCARILAKAINCMNPTADGEACNECESCRAFNEGRSLNIFELDAASNNSVENIKALMEQTLIPPQTGKYKVFIIDEVHMLSQAAFNAFLKTLEEPPQHVIFILATTEKHKILPTILSRCQIYDFERMTVGEIVEHLKMVAQKENITYEEAALGVIAEKADGGMRDALSIFDQVASFCQGNITYQKTLEDLNVLDADNYFNIIDLSLENKVADIMRLLDGIIARGFDVGGVINGLASHVRNVMMAKDAQTLPLLETSDAMRRRYQEQAAKCPPKFLYRALKILNECDVQYRQSSNKRLLCELTLIRVAQITQPDDDDDPGAGRSPKKLKYIFKRVVAATTKPAAQPSQAKPTSSTPSTNQQHQDGGTKVAKPTPTPVLRLDTIGTTFASLRHSAAPAEPDEQPEDEKKADSPQEEQHFTTEELLEQWRQMCGRMPQKFAGLAARLRNITPRITDYPNVEAVVDNGILLEQLNAIRRNIRATLRKTLGNAEIEFTLRLAKQEHKGPALTKRQMFDSMRKDNQAIELLRMQLGLELA